MAKPNILEKEVIAKADLALSDLTGSGGYLANEQSESFVQTLIDQPTILNEARVVTMKNPKMEINKIKFGSRILKASGLDPTDTVTYDGRKLKYADHAKPTTSKITLDAKAMMAEVNIPYEVLEDNIERGNFASTILTLMARRIALDLEELIITGDTGSGDAFLALTDGLVASATSNVVDFASNPISASRLNAVQKALPTEFRRNLAQMRYYTSMNVENDMRLALSGRGTPLGDQLLQANQPLQVLGSGMRGCALMPEANLIYTNPKNIVVGFHRDIMIETDREIRERQVVFVASVRADVKFEEETAVVKGTNIAAVS